MVFLSHFWQRHFHLKKILQSAFIENSVLVLKHFSTVGGWHWWIFFHPYFSECPRLVMIFQTSKRADKPKYWDCEVCSGTKTFCQLCDYALLDLFVKWGEEYSENDSLVVHLRGHLGLSHSRTSQRKGIKLISFDFEGIVFL